VNVLVELIWNRTGRVVTGGAVEWNLRFGGPGHDQSRSARLFTVHKQDRARRECSLSSPRVEEECNLL